MMRCLRNIYWLADFCKDKLLVVCKNSASYGLQHFASTSFLLYNFELNL